MIANYKGVDLKVLESFKNMSEADISNAVVALFDDDDKLCDIDKSWDGIHFLLTGDHVEDSSRDNLLTVFIFGFKDLCEGEFISIIDSDKVKHVAEIVNKIDISKCVDKVNFDRFKDAGIYPDIWYPEEIEINKEYLATNFESLKKFYNQMADEGLGIVVSIC